MQIKVRNERMSIRRKIAAAVVFLLAGVAGAMVAPSPAMARYEGHCENNDYWLEEQRPLPCYGSDPVFYEFYDNNSSYEKTTLHLVDCSSNPEIRLERREGSRWDSMGSKIFYCINYDSGWLSWNDMDEGLYRWVLVDARHGSWDSVFVEYYHGAW